MPAPMPAEDIVVVGRVGSPYGVKGWVNVQSFTTPADNLLQYRPWCIQAAPQVRAARWRTLELQQCKPHKKGYVALFAGIGDRDAAAELTGALIGVQREALPEPAEADEYYWRDLIGATVRTSGGDVLGSVDHLLETGAHDVLVIKRADSAAEDDLLIPFVEQYVLAVDAETASIVVAWDPAWS